MQHDSLDLDLIGIHCSSYPASHRPRGPRIGLAAALVLLGPSACGSEPSPVDGSETSSSGPSTSTAEETNTIDGGTTAGTTTEGTSGLDGSSGGSSGSSSEGSSGSDSGTDAPTTSGSSSESTTGETVEGCTKIDLLFVIDNSGSMAEEQGNLVDAFSSLVSGLQSSLAQVAEYQVGVVTTDAYTPNVAVPGCNVLGGLVVQTGGSDSSNSVCGPYAAGANFMTEADDLPAAFACAADVGTAGDGIERPMDAMTAVVDEVHGGPGECNEGYLRDDALLVVVIITDEYDGADDFEGQSSAGDPASWYDTVVAAKGGHPENVVAMGLLNYAGGACPPIDPVFDGVNIASFVGMFGANGLLGGICEPDYGPVFVEAVGVIEQACYGFQAP